MINAIFLCQFKDFSKNDIFRVHRFSLKSDTVLNLTHFACMHTHTQTGKSQNVYSKN